MIHKKEARLRRARATRARIALQKVSRLTVNRTNTHIYAQLIDDSTGRTLCASSSRTVCGAYGGTMDHAKQVGSDLAEKAKAAGIQSVAFDRAGYRYHGRVKALAEAARAGGLKF